MDFVGQAFTSDLNDSYTVEAQQGKVGEVFVVKGVFVEMGVDVTESGQPLGRRPKPSSLGQKDLSRISNDYLLYVPSPVYEDPQLPSDLPGDLRQVSGEFRGAYLTERNQPPIDTLDPFGLILL